MRACNKKKKIQGLGHTPMITTDGADLVYVLLRDAVFYYDNTCFILKEIVGMLKIPSRVSSFVKKMSDALYHLSLVTPSSVFLANQFG